MKTIKLNSTWDLYVLPAEPGELIVLRAGAYHSGPPVNVIHRIDREELGVFIGQDKSMLMRNVRFVFLNIHPSVMFWSYPEDVERVIR